MEIEITIHGDGIEECLVVNILEDLWHDYLHFKNAAQQETSVEPAFMQKRYI